MAKGKFRNFIPANDRLKAVQSHCPVCGEPDGWLTSKSPRFKAGITYFSDMPCNECKPNFDKMVDFLAAGGTLVKCTKCESVTVILDVPESLMEKVSTMPDGTRRLEIYGCANCTKEGDNGNPKGTDPSCISDVV